MAVEVLRDEGRGFRIKVTNDNFQTSFYIGVDPNDQYGHYGITTSEGKVGKSLAGGYTDPLRALDSLRVFLTNAKETKATRRENRYGAANGKDGTGADEQGAGN
jgi:hypothetical protein